MTTVEFGGGPTIEARRRFANLKDGSEIPRYAGHVHQLRFRHGHTYGEETHLVSKEFPRLKRVKSEIVVSKQPNPYETREFPDGLIPGYAGYVPQRQNEFGSRFRIETDASKSKTKAAYEKGRQKAKDLQRAISSYPKTKSINSDTVLQHFLDHHRAYYPIKNSTQADRRPFLEGPIPGYQGHIPRMISINLGVGSRYQQAAEKALNRFGIETTNSMTNFSTSTDDIPASANFTRSLINFDEQRPTTTRIFSKSGMIPRYAGYLPQRKYRVGQTFGDTTRNLPVCSHSFSSYGDLVRSNSFLESSTTNFQ